MTRPLALVTGATVGIGYSFAEFLAARGHDLVIVARDEERLNQRASEWREKYGCDVEIIRADLSNTDQLAMVEERIRNHPRAIDVLINNAGFGINKSFLISPIEAENDLLEVLVRAPMRLTHAALPRMRERNQGTIINVSSVAGWIAGGTYSAAKSYVTVLTESLHTELKGTNVRIHALCPGFTRTEFHQRGRMKMGGLPSFMWLTAEQVVSAAWSAAEKGKVISVPGFQYKVLSAISRFGPRPLVRKVGMNVRTRQRN